MKKTLLIATLLMLGACSQTANTSNTALNVCLTTKANAAIQDGSAFTTDLTTLAKKISSACLKQLALEKSGLSEESVTAATNLLAALKEAKSS